MDLQVLKKQLDECEVLIDTRQLERADNLMRPLYASAPNEGRIDFLFGRIFYYRDKLGWAKSALESAEKKGYVTDDIAKWRELIDQAFEKSTSDVFWLHYRPVMVVINPEDTVAMFRALELSIAVHILCETEELRSHLAGKFSEELSKGKVSLKSGSMSEALPALLDTLDSDVMFWFYDTDDGQILSRMLGCTDLCFDNDLFIFRNGEASRSLCDEHLSKHECLDVDFGSKNDLLVARPRLPEKLVSEIFPEKMIKTSDVLGLPSPGKKGGNADSAFLNEFRGIVSSQNGEDGILEEIIKRIEAVEPYFVEVGAGNGIDLSNTANLRDHHGWKGLMLEAEPMAMLDSNHDVKAAYVTAENVTGYFDKYKVPKSFGVLSIDIDSADIYVWEGLSDRYRPAVVVMDYNASLPNSYPLRAVKDVVEDIERIHLHMSHAYYNANLNAVYDVAKAKGYEFVTTVEWNAVFVRSDLIDQVGAPKLTKAEVMSAYGLIGRTFEFRKLLLRGLGDRWLLWE